MFANELFLCTFLKFFIVELIFMMISDVFMMLQILNNAFYWEFFIGSFENDNFLNVFDQFCPVVFQLITLSTIVYVYLYVFVYVYPKEISDPKIDEISYKKISISLSSSN